MRSMAPYPKSRPSPFCSQLAISEPLVTKELSSAPAEILER